MLMSVFDALVWRADETGRVDIFCVDFKVPNEGRITDKQQELVDQGLPLWFIRNEDDVDEMLGGDNQ